MNFILRIYNSCRGAQIEEKPLPEGTIKDFADFDAEEDCRTLNEALKGGAEGRDEAKIIDVIARRSNKQRQQIREQYAQIWGTDLMEEIRSELGSQLLDAVLALLARPDEFDASSLHHAMKCACTPMDSTLIEIMFSRSSEEIKAIIAAYTVSYKHNLADALQSQYEDTPKSYLSKLLHHVTQATREEGVVDTVKAKEDAQKLHSEKISGGTHFDDIVSSNSFEQLELVFAAYEKIAKMTMEEAIKSEESGDLEEELLAVIKCLQDKPVYFAERLHESIKGTGTNDKTLIRLIVSRSEVDLVQVKEVFLAKYGQSLEEFVEEDISKLAPKLLENYKNLLVQICRGN